MSNASFTPDEFEAAIASLIGKGIRPTVRKLRLLLGSGSHETIGPMLAAWRERQPAPAAESAVPAPVQAKAAEFGAMVWVAANAQARAELDTVRQHLQQQRAELAEELEDTRLEVNDLESTVADLQRQLERERERHRDECHRRAEAETRCNQLSRLESVMAKQSDELKRVQGLLSEKATEAVRHQAAAETLQRQLDELIKALGSRGTSADGHGSGTTEGADTPVKPARGQRESKKGVG